MTTHTNELFINAIAPGAVAAQEKYGVPASITMAQAILESAWGASGLAKDAHNLFGIKGVGPDGSVTMPTKEFENGHYISVEAVFRKYHDYAESIDDHAKLLATSSNYKKAMADRGNADKFANDLTGVYATDPHYGTELEQLMKEHDLYRFNGTSPSRPPTVSATYTVEKGDTMSSIAARHGVTLEALERANPQVKDPGRIYPGEKLNLPPVV